MALPAQDREGRELTQRLLHQHAGFVGRPLPVAVYRKAGRNACPNFAFENGGTSAVSSHLAGQAIVALLLYATVSIIAGSRACLRILSAPN